MLAHAVDGRRRDEPHRQRARTSARDPRPYAADALSPSADARHRGRVRAHVGRGDAGARGARRAASAVTGASLRERVSGPAPTPPAARAPGAGVRRRHDERAARACPSPTTTGWSASSGACSATTALLVVAVVLANALAATAGLLVPRLLGNLVDSTVADVAAGEVDAALAGANAAALVVAGLVVIQSLFTFAAKMSSTVLGQNVLASAREFIVRAILRLPLSRVESASSGDLVTRVTRDVGTMSESVRWALPEAIIASITVVLTLVAMVSNSLAAVPAVDRAHGARALPGAALPAGAPPRATSPRAAPTRASTRPSPRPSRVRARSRRSGSASSGCAAATTTSRCPARPSATR